MVARIRDFRYDYCYGYVLDIKINIQEPQRFISIGAKVFNRNCDCQDDCLFDKNDVCVWNKHTEKYINCYYTEYTCRQNYLLIF